MPGPAPKPESARQRRNRKSTALVLVRDEDAEVPALPDPPYSKQEAALGLPHQWEPMAVEFWNDVWRSGARYSEVDAHGLLYITELVHHFHRVEDLDEKRKLHTEIRIARRDYGLTPMSRASLHWTVAEAHAAEDRVRKERAKPRAAEATAEEELAALGP